MNKKIIFIAGGGTGGHIYPGIAIAKAIKHLDSHSEIRFVGSAIGMESKLVPREGFELHLIASGKLNFGGRWKEKILTLLKIPIALFQSIFLLIKYKPHYVLGVGGYASGPFVLAASLLKYRCGIWEPNAFPGMTNRILSKKVDECFVVFDEARKILKCDKIYNFGMPVRAEIEKSYSVPKADLYSELEKEVKILCFGGSQGSRVINNVFSKVIIGHLMEHLRNKHVKLEVVHQIGSLDWKQFNRFYQGIGNWLHPMEFIFDMPKYYSWAHLTVCRGGASTIAEVAAFGLVPIIVPLPAADNHQVKNAQALVKEDAAIMIEQSDLTEERLMHEMTNLLSNPQKLKQMSENIKKFFTLGAADNIAKEVLK